MQHPSQSDAPLVEGGQGRSSEAVDASTAAFAWCNLGLLILLLVAGVVG